MIYVHTQKNIQDSPRKLRLVADMIRKMRPSRALEVLEFDNHAASKPLSKAIKTALANVGVEGIVFKSIEINEAMKLKRYRAGTAGRGRGRPYKKRWSHIKIVLTDEVVENKVTNVTKETKVGKKPETKQSKESDNKKVEKEMEQKAMEAEEVKEELAEKVEEEIEKNIEQENKQKG